MWKKVVLGLLSLLVVIQFIPVDFSQPAVIPENDFITMHQPDAQVQQILKNACYDCHSNEIKLPWYSKVAPINFWLKRHIDEGKEHLNFSEWGSYEAGKRKHKLEECVEMMEEGEMPLKSYTWAHPEAKLTAEQVEKLIQFFQTVE